MIIPINDRHRINSDQHQWMIQKRRGTDPETGAEIWHSFKYFSTIGNLINHLYDIELRLSKTEGLDEALEAAQNVATLLQQALTPRFKVTLVED